METVLRNLISIAVTWCITGLCFGGIGLLFRRAPDGDTTSRSPIPTDSLLSAIWLGLAITCLFLELWHFVAPVGRGAFLVVATFGMWGLLRSRRALRDLWSPVSWRTHDLQLAALAISALVLATQAMKPTTLYDTGAYHVPAVRWLEHYAIVPGLVNLHGRLGFNNANFLYQALVDNEIWPGIGAHVANSFLVLLLLIQGIRSFSALARDRKGDGWRVDLFNLALLIPTVRYIFHEEISSFGTDLASTCILFAASSRLLGAVSSDRPPSNDFYLSDYALAALLFALALSVKLSQAAFAVLALLMLGILTYHRTDGSRRIAIRRLCGLFALPAVLVAGWVVRGIVLSGYPAYPALVFPAPVDWRIPREQAEAEIAWAMRSTRTPWGQGPTADFAWIRPWFSTVVIKRWKTSTFELLLPLLFMVTLPFVCGPLRRRQGASFDPALRWIYGIVIVAGCYWFMTAPGPRYVSAVLWIGAATIMAARARAEMPARLRDGWVIAGFAAIAAVGSIVIEGPHNDNRAAIRRLVQRISLTRDDVVPLTALPHPRLGRFVTHSGLALNIPLGDTQCWEAELPCTPHPTPGLRLRKSNDLAAGFTSDGTWEPLGWPNPWGTGARFYKLWSCLHRDRISFAAEAENGCLAWKHTTNEPGNQLMEAPDTAP